MPPELLIHIGTHKTGTTAIQQALNRNQQSLAGESIAVIRRHPVFRKIMLSDSPSPELATELRSHLDVESKRRPNAAKYILSYEGFSGDVGVGYTNAAHVAEVLRDATEGIATRIIVYLRRQDSFLESAYIQSIKEGNGWDFPTFLSRRTDSWFDWQQLLACYANAFSRSQIIARRYDKSVLPDTEALLSSFSKAIGSQKLRSGNVSANPGLDRDAVELARICNPHLAPESRKQLRTILQRTNPREPLACDSYLAPSQRKHLLEQYRESNRAVAEEYFDGDAGGLFPEPRDPEPEPAHPQASPESLAITITKILLAQDQQNKQYDDATLSGRIRKPGKLRSIAKNILYANRLGRSIRL